MGLLKKLTPIAILAALCWTVFLLNTMVWHGSLNRFGIIPRHLGSLPGIIWAPFLHASFKHLAANTLPLLILGSIICARSPREFRMVTLGGIILGGGLTWLLARPACHIGASGLIFSYFGYLASMAYFRRTVAALLLSLVCVLAYGGMLQGILPTSSAISWESHAAGLVAGVALAWFSAKLHSPQKKVTFALR